LCFSYIFENFQIVLEQQKDLTPNNIAVQEPITISYQHLHLLQWNK